MRVKSASVCIHLTASLDRLELIQMDETGQGIHKAVSVSVGFIDPISRRINEPEDVQNTLRHLLGQAHIPTSSNPAVLVLPSYFSRQLELSSDFKADELKLALLGEVESHYIFKNQDPVVECFPLGNRQVVYSAFLQRDIDVWIEAFQAVHLPLLAIDIDYFAALRGLLVTPALQPTVLHQRPWLAMTVSDYSCCFIACLGAQVQHMQEMPLGSEDPQTALQDICDELVHFTGDIPYDQLMLINNTMKIDPTVLRDRLSYTMPVVDIQQNGRTVVSLGATEGDFPCCIEAIGGPLSLRLPSIPHLNFAPSAAQDLLEADTVKHEVFQWLVMANIAVAVLCGVMWVGLSGWLWFREQALQHLTQSGANTSANTVMSSASLIEQKHHVKTLQDKNLWINDMLVVLGSRMPDNTWLTSIMVQDNQSAKRAVEVRGGCLKPEPLNTLQQALNSRLGPASVELASVDLADNSKTDPTQNTTTGNSALPKTAAAGSVPSDTSVSYYVWLLKTPEPMH